ncbi:MAG: cobyrinate a,c-diamide synthase [bacterium]
MVECKSPRLVLCGLRGGSGKTVVTLGLIGTLKESGLRVAPFKKGPDYIDPAWHSLAAGRSCHNLDSFFFDGEQILRSFEEYSRQSDIAVIEGNRGLYDGVDAQGSHSTAELAKRLASPVILVVDCTKVSRTLAAMVLGCQTIDRHLTIAGVILNRVSGSRHEAIVRASIEQATSVPVLGALPRIEKLMFSERHLGLLPPPEHPDATQAVQEAVDAVRKGVDVDAVTAIARSATPIQVDSVPMEVEDAFATNPRIGVVRDGAFNFYYPENIEDLQRCGAEIVEINALHDTEIPQVDALYIGGGFPETHAAALAANRGFREDLRRRIEAGLPVLAECGGLVYLCEALIVGGTSYPMVGAFPVTFDISKRPEGHGYAEVVVDRPNPFFERGLRLRGHEFRYSRVHSGRLETLQTAFRMERGCGFDGKRDGLCYKNVLASFCHFHSRSVRGWAKGFVNRALDSSSSNAGSVEDLNNRLYYGDCIAV